MIRADTGFERLCGKPLPGMIQADSYARLEYRVTIAGYDDKKSHFRIKA